MGKDLGVEGVGEERGEEKVVKKGWVEIGWVENWKWTIGNMVRV